MGRHERWRLRLADVLALATTASAMSLSNFQVITSSAVPLSCILAYNNVINGCSANDFSQGRSCSASCVQGIQRAEAILASACEGVNAPGTVLEQAIFGNLVNLLCPSGNPPPPLGGAGQDGAGAVAAATASRQILTLTALPPSSAAPSLAPLPTNIPPLSQPPPPPPPQEATQIGASPAQTSLSVINPTQATGARETNSPAPSSDDTGGGGSPFDVSAAVSFGARQLAVPRLETLLATGALILLLR